MKRKKIITPKSIKQGIVNKTNKSLSKSPRKPKRTIPCRCCGEPCSGKLNIEARKGKLYPFCTNCFNILEYKTNKEVRKKIKLNKHGVII